MGQDGKSESSPRGAVHLEEPTLKNCSPTGEPSPSEDMPHNDLMTSH
jgi:hypothetical protein